MEILHKKGEGHVILDAFSLRDEEVVSYTTSIMVHEWLDEI
jgi:hypothetical protein